MMSDCFNHCQDAYDSTERCFNDGGVGAFVKAPLRRLKISGLIHETEKTCLFKDSTGFGKFWIPKSLISGVNVQELYIVVYSKFLEKLEPLGD